MFKTLFPNLNKIGAICISIPVTTASVERSFSQIKLIKTYLRSSLNDKSLSNLMKIALESPVELTGSHLEEIVDIWSRKSRRIIVQMTLIQCSMIVIISAIQVMYVHTL